MKKFISLFLVTGLCLSLFGLTGCRLFDHGSDDTPVVPQGVAFALNGKLNDPNIKPSIAADIKANISIENDKLEAFVYKVAEDGKTKEKVNNGVGFPLDPDGSYKCNFVGEGGYYLIQIESSVKTNFLMSIVIGELTAENATQSDLEVNATTTAVALLVEEKGFQVKTKEKISSFAEQNKTVIDTNAALIQEAAKTDGTIAVTEITMNATASVNIGSTLTLQAYVVPSIASNKTIVWSIVSGDTFLDLNTSTGVVTGSAVGQAVVTAKAGDITKDVTVNVLAVDKPVTSVTIAGKSSIEVRETATLTVTIEPSDATDQVVTWSLSPGGDTNLTITKTGDKTATITGKVITTTAVTVTATVGGQTGTTNVTVVAETIKPVALKKSVDGALPTLVIRIKNVDAAFDTTTTLLDVTDNVQTLVKDIDLTNDFGALTLKAKDVVFAEFLTLYKEFDSITFADNLPDGALVEVYDVNSNTVLTTN